MNIRPFQQGAEQAVVALRQACGRPRRWDDARVNIVTVPRGFPPY
jgi:hypothetical protein